MYRTPIIIGKISRQTPDIIGKISPDKTPQLRVGVLFTPKGLIFANDRRRCRLLHGYLPK